MFTRINGRRVWVELGAPDGDGGGSGGEGGGNQQPPPADGTADKIMQGITNLLQRNGGDAQAVVKMLYQDNYALRDELRQVKGKVPADGAVILTGDDATRWAAYTQLGLPAELQTAISERTQFQGELNTLRRDGVLRDVAEVAGYKFGVLRDLDGRQKLHYEIREVEQDGQKRKTVFVKSEGGNETTLEQYAGQAWADYLPALTVAAAQQTQQVTQGTRHVTQHAGSGGQGQPDLVDKYLQTQEEKAKAVKNPLLRG